MPRLTLLIFAAILAAGAGLRIGALLAHQRVDFDEGRYLDNAAHLLEGHGLATSTVSFYFGDPARPPRPEDISSPLFPLMLAGLFLATGVSFEAGKIMALALSLAAIPLVYLLGKRLFGEAEGLVAAGLLALQPDQAIVGSWVMTESLYGALLLLAILAAAPLALGGPWSRGRSVAAGALLGLLYLARQNGAAIAVSIALFLLLAPACRFIGGFGRRAGAVLLMAAVCFALCVPWFARNVARFGSPTFSPLKHVAWAEHARSLYTPAAESPSMRSYLRDHGAGGLARNLARRVQRVGHAVLLAESGPFRWVAILGLLAPFSPALRWRALLLLAPAALTSVLLLGVATWSGAIPRYLLPVRPLLYLSGAALLVLLARGLSRSIPSPAARRLAAASLLLAAVVAGSVTSREVYGGYLTRDQGSRHEAALEASRWISGHTSPGDVILEGGFLHQYAWRFRRGVVWIPHAPLSGAFDVAARYGATYLAVTAEVLRFRPDLHRYWRDTSGRIEPLEDPPGLDLAYDGRSSGVMIYRIRQAAGGVAGPPAGEKAAG